MTNASTRILGLDPGLRRTGWGVVTAEGSRLRWVAHGVVTPPETAPLSERLLWLLEKVGEVCAAHGCDEAAIEEVFVNVNPASTLKLGQARAAVMLAPARCGLSVAEYSPNLVKKAVVGAGHADKSQIAFMVKRLLPTCGEVKADAADALAVAITHAQLRKRALLVPPPSGEGDRVAVEGAGRANGVWGRGGGAPPAAPPPPPGRANGVWGRPPPSRREAAPRHLPQWGRIGS